MHFLVIWPSLHPFIYYVFDVLFDLLHELSKQTGGYPHRQTQFIVFLSEFVMSSQLMSHN